MTIEHLMHEKISNAKCLRACLIMRAPLSRYPSSVYQAELLAEAGVAVTLFDTEDGGYHACPDLKGVSRDILARGNNPWGTQTPLSRLLAPIRRWQFHSKLLWKLGRLSADLVVAYEPPAIASVGRCWPAFRKNPPRWAWHFHEYPEADPRHSPGTLRDVAWSRRHHAMSDLIIFPDEQRAEHFRQETGLSKLPAVVMNCPRRLERIPAPSLRQRLHEQGHPASVPLVLFHGCVGSNYALVEVIRSMSFWPADALFVLVGAVTNGFRRELTAEAQSARVSRRVVLLGTPDPNDNWSLRAGADVAVTPIVPRRLNLRFCSGAANKRFETMAVGVPQVTDCNPGVPELVEKTGAGICVAHNNVEGIGRAVARLLQNEALRDEMGMRARQLHLERFNYEAEFQPVLRQLVEGPRPKEHARQTT